MEEVDAIILPILREVGCNLSADITSVKQLDADTYYSAVVLVLRTINTTNADTSHPKHPPTMPQGKAARFRITTALATEIKDKGYPHECGYEAFLYPNEADQRKLLRWLVDKLPKADADTDGDSAAAVSSAARGGGASVNVWANIASALKTFSSRQWTPLNARAVQYQSLTAAPIIISETAEKDAARVSFFKSNECPVISAQCPSANLIPAVHAITSKYLALNADKSFSTDTSAPTKPLASHKERADALNAIIDNAFRRSRSVQQSRDLSQFALPLQSAKASAVTSFTRSVLFETEAKPVTAQVVSDVGTVTAVDSTGASAAEAEAAEAAAAVEREEQLSTLNNRLQEFLISVKNFDTSAEQFITQQRQVEAELTALTQSTTALEDAYKVKKRTLDLLPNAQQNLSDLSAVVEQSSKRLIELANEWEQHRLPLVNKLRRNKQLLNERKSEVSNKIETIKKFRDEMRIKADLLREKDLLYKNIAEEYNNMPKTVNRQVYVRRIMDIMKNLDKQKLQINNILEDVKKLQKDINILNDTSSRSFAMADEVVFQAAKNSKNNAAANSNNSNNAVEKENAALNSRAYKCVVELRSKFVTLVSTVEMTGRIQNECREINQNVDELESTTSGLNMERVQNDLAAVKKENKTLMAKVKKSKEKE